MQLDELFIKLGFKTDTKELDNFGKSAEGAKVNLLGVVAAATATVMAIEKIAEATAHAVNNLQNFNAQTGLSIGKLQQMQITGQLQNIGLSAEDVSQSVQALQSNLANIRLGQGNIAPFQMLGIDVIGQDAFGVIDQLRERIKGLDDMTATNIIQQMGLNPNMITMLRMSKNEFTDLNKEIALTYDERQNIQSLGVEIKKTQLIIQATISKTIAKWTPTLKAVAQFIQNIVYAIKRLNLTFPILVIGLGSILKVFKLLNKETLLWTIGLTALFLLLDDYAVWAKGGLSAFDYSGIEGFFKAINKGFEELNKNKAIIDKISNIANKFLMFGIGGGIGSIIGDIPNMLLNNTANNNNIVSNIIGGGGTAVGIAINQAQNDRAREEQNQINNSSNNSSMTQNNNITINSNAADGRDVAKSLQVPLNNATQAMVYKGEKH